MCKFDKVRHEEQNQPNPVRVKVLWSDSQLSLDRTQLNTPAVKTNSFGGITMSNLIFRLWTDDQGQDIAEYAVMLAVILVIVVGTIRLIGSNANTVFSSAASSIQ
jgi:Flp pilus assembly pilin Flp